MSATSRGVLGESLRGGKAELHRANKVRCAISGRARRCGRCTSRRRSYRFSATPCGHPARFSVDEGEGFAQAFRGPRGGQARGGSHEQGAHGGDHGVISEHWVARFRPSSVPARSKHVEAHFSARPAARRESAGELAHVRHERRLRASVRARIGDTRRILDLRTSGEAAVRARAHASTRRRMDRASTVARRRGPRRSRRSRRRTRRPRRTDGPLSPRPFVSLALITHTLLRCSPRWVCRCLGTILLRVPCLGASSSSI